MEDDQTYDPLLDGDLAERVRTAIGDIATAVRDMPAPDSCELADGAAGHAVFFGYAAGLFDDDELAAVAEEHLDAAVSGLAQQPLGVALLGGLCGVAWTVDHMTDPDDDEEDPNADIDAALLDGLSGDDWPGVYDLVSGLAGIGVYAAQRGHRDSGRALLSRVVHHFDKLAEPRDEGLCWHTPPEHLPEWQREIAPNGYDNLGLAHGIPAIIGVLAKAVELDVDAARARTLLEGGVPWLLAQRMEGVDAEYAAWLSDADEPPSRSAWCYGDPGVAVPLLMAARALDRDDWEAAARQTARGIAQRAPDQCGVRDTGLCHGGAGLAHLLHRLYRATGDEVVRDSAIAWFERTLDLRRDGEGVAGFVEYRPPADGEPAKYTASAGFLTGAVGVGLALIGAVAGDEPAWDSALLVDIAPLRT